MNFDFDGSEGVGVRGSCLGEGDFFGGDGGDGEMGRWGEI